MSEPLWVPIGAVSAVGDELAYAEVTANTNITAHTRATAQTVITAPAITVDGLTPIVVEVCLNGIVLTGALGQMALDLFEGSTHLGSFGAPYMATLSVPSTPIRTAVRFTPPAGAHTYSFKAWTPGTPIGVVNAGTGGVDANYPSWIRVSTVRPTGVGAGGAAVPACRVYSAIAQGCANGTWTPIGFELERFDTGGIHETAANNGRLTCKEAGKYLITGHLAFAGNVTGMRAARIQLNGTTPIGMQAQPTVPTGFTIAPVSVTTLYDLAVNDYVTLDAYQDSTATLNVNVFANASPEFGMVKVG